MALQQYNQFEPKLAGLEGNMQAEPRVFAHDAVPVVIGAINASNANKGLTITASGNGFIVGEVITYAAGSPAGAGLTLTVTEIDGGAVTNFDVTTPGSGYLVGENLTFTTSGAGAAFTVTVSNIDIPNTQRRGCCLYVGNSGDVQVIMESGNTAIFVGAATGAFLPILAKQVTAANTTATLILALY
tara:strand:- start:78 stop:635 length:558 start_codon:yes stop_codon:yes gene_type:complete